MTSKPILTGAEYISLPRGGQPFLLEPLLPKGGAMTIYGEPKTGKSYLAIQLALAITSGKSFLGFPVRENGKVVYIQLDTPGSLWSLRLRELTGKGHKVDDIYQADLETLETFPFDCTNPEHALKLHLALAAINPIAVIIDTLKEAHQKDENDATELQKVIAALNEITRPAALILLHHSRKPSQDKPEELLTSARGSGYLLGKMDAILMLSKKSLQWIGRAIERGSIRLTREDDGFWVPSSDELDVLIEDVLQTPGSDREHAKRLAERVKKSEEACRSLIRRYKASITASS